MGFAVLLAVTAWIVALLVTDADEDQQINQAESRASNLALLFEEQVFRQILSVDQILRIIKADWERAPLSFDNQMLQRRELSTSDLVSQIMVLNARGRVIASSRPDLSQTDFSSRRYFQVHRTNADQAPLITGPFQNNGHWSLSVSRRLNLARGEFGGVVAASYDLDGLTRDMAEADLGPNGMIMLVGRDGAVRAMSVTGMQDPGGDINSSALYRAVFGGTARTWTGPSAFDNTVRIHAWRQIPGQDLVLIVGLDRATALRGPDLRRAETLLGTGAITLLVLIMAGGGAASISAAAAREQRLAHDRAVLAAANLRLAEARERADEKSLQLGMTLAGMSDGVCMFDGQLQLVLWNHRFAELNGLGDEVLRVGLSMLDILQLQVDAGEFRPTDAEAASAGLMLASQDSAETQIALRLRPNGSFIEMRQTRLPDGGSVTLYTDVTTRKQVEDAQSRAREQAELAAQEKSRFVAIVSHEIRSPLNVALNSLALLERSDLAPAQRQLVSTGLLAGESLMALLNDILDLSRMQVGRMQMRAAPFALRPLLEGIVALFAHQAEERGVEFSVVTAPDVPDRLMTDSGRLRQALMNLVNNAAKFAEPGPASIRVGLATLEGEPVLRFAVRDCGPDIPDLDRARLFRPFSQLQHPGSTGTGLGLAICQLLVNLLGGQIGCDRVPGGKEFWLTLPADVLDVRAEAAPPAPDRLPLPRLPRTRVLVVEDIAASQVVIATALRREGHMVDLASSGLEALQKIPCSPYDIVLLDIFMPGIDGLETARRIRGLPGSGKKVPIVALTANVSAGDRAAYLAAGMDDLVAKPMELATLLHVLDRHVWQRARASGRPEKPIGVLQPETPASRAAIDLERVHAWRNGLQISVSDALFAECVSQLRDMTATLHTALAQRQPLAVKQTTHAMIGVAGNYGLSALAAAVRTVASDPDALDPDEQADRVDREIDRAEQAVAALPQAEAV